MFWTLLACVDLAWVEPAATLQIAPETVTFPDTALGASVSRTVQIRNVGDRAQRLDLLVEAPFYAPAALDVPVGETELELSFRPSAHGPTTGTLRLLGPSLRLELPLSGRAAEDTDEDGSPDSLDCAPTDPSRHPGATDPCGDGLDQDCDGRDSLDCDGDGALPPLDCDDADSTVFPGASEAIVDRLDQDCDGAVDEAALVVGDLLITELHPGEPPWLELCSLAARDIELGALELRLSGQSRRFPAGPLPAGACVAVCEASGCAFELDFPELDRRSGSVLLLGDQLLDQVDWSGWADPGVGSWSLDSSARSPGANDAAAAWCVGSGSPGQANAACP
ncbi:MAG TPA: MopE-related protein [Myxococcota bacterium]|nr:MopE-related protein [Myxococcota bacterium]